MKKLSELSIADLVAVKHELQDSIDRLRADFNNKQAEAKEVMVMKINQELSLRIGFIIFYPPPMTPTEQALKLC